MGGRGSHRQALLPQELVGNTRYGLTKLQGRCSIGAGEPGVFDSGSPKFTDAIQRVRENQRSRLVAKVAFRRTPAARADPSEMIRGLYFMDSPGAPAATAMPIWRVDAQHMFLVAENCMRKRSTTCTKYAST